MIFTSFLSAKFKFIFCRESDKDFLKFGLTPALFGFNQNMLLCRTEQRMFGQKIYAHVKIDQLRQNFPENSGFKPSTFWRRLAFPSLRKCGQVCPLPKCYLDWVPLDSGGPWSLEGLYIDFNCFNITGSIKLMQHWLIETCWSEVQSVSMDLPMTSQAEK